MQKCDKCFSTNNVRIRKVNGTGGHTEYIKLCAECRKTLNGGR